MKVLVTGNAGSGKSTLSKKIAAETGLPWYGLDTIVWQEGWKKTPEADRQKQIAAITQQPDWIIDGVSFDIQARADVIIFLDKSRLVCFWRVFKRNRKYLFSSRPGLPPHCPEILIILTLIKVIGRFPRHIRPKILTEKDFRNPATFIHVKTKSDVQNLQHMKFHS